MPDISTQQADAAALIREQIEALEHPAQTLPYWEVYRAISSEGGGGSTDISTLTKEATLTAINAKIPSLSNNRIPVELPTTNLTADWRILTAGTTTIPAGSCYVYIMILTGTVTINGLTKTATNGINDIVNLESCLPARHPAITIIIPEGASVELIRGF